MQKEAPPHSMPYVRPRYGNDSLYQAFVINVINPETFQNPEIEGHHSRRQQQQMNLVWTPRFLNTSFSTLLFPIAAWEDYSEDYISLKRTDG